MPLLSGLVSSATLCATRREVLWQQSDQTRHSHPAGFVALLPDRAPRRRRILIVAGVVAHGLRPLCEVRSSWSMLSVLLLVMPRPKTGL